MRKKTSRKKKAAVRKTGSRKSATQKAASRKKVTRKAAGKKTGRRSPPKKKKTIPRAGTRPARPRPVPPGAERPPMTVDQPGIRAAEEDEHGPMHLPSHKPAPAYAEMHKRDWANQPPVQDIPVPKR
jgi:hypothetical protein